MSSYYLSNIFDTNLTSIIKLSNLTFNNTMMIVDSSLGLYLSTSTPNFVALANNVTINNIFFNKTQGFNSLSGFLVSAKLYCIM